VVASVEILWEWSKDCVRFRRPLESEIRIVCNSTF
jgi:hypothetical protein